MAFGEKGNNEVSIEIDNTTVKGSTEKNLLGINFDQSLSFKQHVKNICKSLVKSYTLLPEFRHIWTLKTTAVNEGICLISI